MDAELVEVVQVRHAEDDRREEDGRCVGGVGQEEEGHGAGAEEELFGDGALGGCQSSVWCAAEGSGTTYRDEIPISNPPTDGLVQSPQADPVSPPAFCNAGFEQRPHEEDGCEGEHLGDFVETHGEQAHPVQRLERAAAVDGGERDEGEDGAEGGRDGHAADAALDDGGGIARDALGGPGGGREVEGHDVDEGVEDQGGDGGGGADLRDVGFCTHRGQWVFGCLGFCAVERVAVRSLAEGEGKGRDMQCKDSEELFTDPFHRAGP